MTEKNLTRN